MGHRLPERGVTQSQPLVQRQGDEDRKGINRAGSQDPEDPGPRLALCNLRQVTIPPKCHQLGVMIPFISHDDQMMKNDMN